MHFPGANHMHAFGVPMHYLRASSKQYRHVGISFAPSH